MTKERKFFRDEGSERRAQRSRQARNLEALQLEVPRTLARPPSASSCKFVLMELDKLTRDGEARYVRMDTLARRCNFCGRGTVQRCLSALRQMGLVAHTRTGRSSLYSVNHARIAELTGAPSEPPPTEGNPPELEPSAMNAPAPITSAQRTHDKSAAHAPKERSARIRSREGTLKQTLTSSSSRAAPAASDLGEEAERVLVEEGVGDVSGTLAAAAARGVSTAMVLLLVAHYRSKPGAWGPAGLSWRVKNAVPDEDPTKRWPREKRAPAVYGPRVQAILDARKAEEERRERRARR